MNKTTEIDLLSEIGENQLQNILSEMGYKARHAQFKNSKIVRGNSSEDFTDEPCLWLMAQENNLESHCVISIEDHVLYVYCYDDYNDIFRVWDRFETKVAVSDLSKTINLATNIELVLKKLDYK